MQATIHPMQSRGGKQNELSFSETPEGKGGPGGTWKGATTSFAICGRVAFSAMDSLMKLCRGLKKFPKG
jgi:hypothetical protein